MWLAGLKMLAGPVINMIKGGVDKFQLRKQKSQDARVAWETVAGESMKGSWKDEYVTIVVTFPILQMFVGNLMFALTGNTEIMRASDASFEQLGLMMGTPYGDLMMTVVLAAVGIKLLKR